MSARISFSYFSCCYLYILVVVSLFYLCSSNQKFDDDDLLCMDGERHALLQFKHGLIDEADRLASWVEEERDCCRWAGIACDNSTGHIRNINLRALDGHCDFSDYITDLEYEKASNQRLSGNLSSSLLHLKQLRHLDLSCNNFGFIQIPSFIGSLENLRYLNLSGSLFGGIIPPQLGNLSELHVLSIGNSEYTSMSNMQWLSSLRTLHHLDLRSVDLGKTIDWIQVINTLPSLVQLQLCKCQLSHIYPHVPTLNLTSLSLLDLSFNNFNSFFPQWIFSITSLVTLDLSECHFRGLIPSTSGFHNLTSLKFLHTSGNDFRNSSLASKGLSIIGSNLISLDISACGVSSSFIDSLHNLTSLVSLDVSYNQLTKPIPKSLGNLCNLRDLDLSHIRSRNISLTYLLESFFKCKSPSLRSLSIKSSEVSGHLPGQLGQLMHLERLQLKNNHIVHTIPNSVGRLSFLRTLDLSRNRITGPIPYSIGGLASLKVLDLSDNQLNNILPNSIGQLASLEVLSLSHNQLSGSLPYSLGQLSKLHDLDFSFNFLTGVVTEAHFAKLECLKYLNGKGNNLTLRVRFSKWIPSFQIQDLHLNSWGLGPRFPLWLQSQKDLIYLDISNTGISSPMPPGSFWGSFPNLSYIDMSRNQIYGTLTLSGIPAMLDVLILSSNKFFGKLPDFSNRSRPYFLDLSNNFFLGTLNHFLCLGDMKESNALNLGNNHLSGIIPECWEKWPSLEFLHLENNNLSGGIPKTLGVLFELESLNMGGNKLSGTLCTSSLINLTKLQILQLGKNELTGSIPEWFGREVSVLIILNLRSNNFDGNIPHELCYLKRIQILDLADNNLTGNIPKCFNNFSVMSGKETNSRYPFELFTSDSLVTKGREHTYKSILGLVLLLDLSSNNFSGYIPNELTTLRELQSLNLSRNQLTGKIPEKIGDMKSIESFDLSMNMLYGELPMSLSSLSFLSSINVSYNSLTGRIPSSTQLQSFLESSFFGNKLCGAPLIECCAEKVPDTVYQEEHDGSHGPDWGLIISTGLGLFTGFWIIVAPLIVSRSFRIAYFHFLSLLGYIAYDIMHKYCFYVFSR